MTRNKKNGIMYIDEGISLIISIRIMDMSQAEKYVIEEVTSNLMGEIVTSFDIEQEVEMTITTMDDTADEIDNERVFDFVYENLNAEGLVEEDED